MPFVDRFVISRGKENRKSAREKLGKSDVGEKAPYFRLEDSPLEVPDVPDTTDLKKFKVPAPTFLNTFRPVIEGNSLKDYVESILAPRRGYAKAIEFGGIGSRAFSAFSKGFFAQTFGVTLKDSRSPEERAQSGDIERNHYVIEANMFADECYESLKSERVDSFDLIIERMMAGLSDVPRDPLLIVETLQKWYSMLSPNGVMLIQVPVIYNNILREWHESISTEYASALESRIFLGRSNANLNFSVLSLVKKENAPAVLPKISRGTLRRLLLERERVLVRSSK